MTYDDAMKISRAVNIARRNAFAQEKSKFSGSFDLECQRKSIPPHVLAMVSGLLNGTDLTDQDEEESQECLSVAQIIVNNMKKKKTGVAASRESTA